MGHLIIEGTTSRIRIIHNAALYANLKGQSIVFFTALADIFFNVPHVNTWLDQVSQTDMNRSQKISALVH